MSMVTKTKAGSTSVISDLPPSSQSPGLSSSPAQQPQYAIETEDLRITTACIQRIQTLGAKRQHPSYLRVFVDAGGCSGFQYKFDMTLDQDEPVDPDEDVVFESGAARVVVDAASLDIIKGSTIDFVQEMIKSSFAVVNNPQSESACGCGSSFAVKNFQSNPAIH